MNNTIYIYKEKHYKENNNLYKIGLTVQDVNDRFKQQTNSSYQSKSLEEFELIYHTKIKDNYDLKNVEMGIHYLINNELNLINGGEWFYLDVDPIIYLENKIKEVYFILDKEPDFKFNVSNVYFSFPEINNLINGGDGFVYLYTYKYKQNEIKIGHTTQLFPYNRLKQQYTTAYKSDDMIILNMIDITQYNKIYNTKYKSHQVEHYLHNHFKQYRLQTKDGVLKEWFIDITIDDISYAIKQLFSVKESFNMFDIKHYKNDKKILVKCEKPNSNCNDDLIINNLDDYYNNLQFLYNNFVSGVYYHNKGDCLNTIKNYNDIVYFMNHKYILVKDLSYYCEFNYENVYKDVYILM